MKSLHRQVRRAIAGLRVPIAGAGFLALARVSMALAQSAVGPGVAPAARGVIDVEGGLVQVAAQRDGVVRDVFVKEGEAVRKDQPLAVIDDRLATIQLSINQAQLMEKQAATDAQAVRVEKARRERDRLTPLARTRAVAQKALDDAETELRLATAELAQRKAEIATAEAQVRSASYEREVRTIRAPSDGVIVRRLVRPGDGLSTLNVTSLFYFAPSTERVVRAEVDEQFAPLLREGQSADISLEADQGSVAARGRVTRIGRAYGPRRATTYEPRDRADVRILEAIISFDGPVPPVPLGQRVIVRFNSGARP